MSEANTSQKGQTEALTLPTAQELAASMVDLAAPASDHQASLFQGGGDTLEQLAEISNAQRRARGKGRPEGSVNRRNSDLFDLAMAKGFKHPFVRLMEIISADPAHLCGDRLEGYKLQIRAAEVLLPYDMAKRPTEVKLEGKMMHMFVAGRLTGDLQGQGGGFSLHGNVEELQEVSASDAAPLAQAPLAQDAQAVETTGNKPA